MKYEVYYANKIVTRMDAVPTFSPSEYAFMGEVTANTTQDLFRKLNVEEHSFPRSMSVGDVVREEGAEHYLMCWFEGWQRVD
jgi:hypothetical protein